VLVAGLSARAAADSAARAGFDVTAVDAFADLDQHPAVSVHAIPGVFSARAAARTARSLAADAVVYLSGFENHPRAVSTLARGRALWGNPPDVLRRVRDPIALAHALERRGFAVPSVTLAAPASLTRDRPSWLVKPIRSGGGRHVRRWRPGARVPRDGYLQEFIEGQPGSITFVAAQGRAVPLAISNQLIGDPAFGARGYQYCGSIVSPRDAVADEACALSDAVTAEFGLVGVNGIDFIARNGRAWPIEVNPRWSASMELAEYNRGISVFGAHAAACARGMLPDPEPLTRPTVASAIGKAIVFARRDVTMGDTRGWLSALPLSSCVDGTDASAIERPPLRPYRDIPKPGERIGAGRPVCTVFAAARSVRECYEALVARAQDVYADLASWERAVA
jgi:predicted ATP-grasp superfamily ATP-dependent carboligase